MATYAATTVGASVRDSLARRGIAIANEAPSSPSSPSAAAAGEPILVLADHTFVTDKCLGDFLDRALDVVADARVVRLALARTPSADFLRPVSSIAVEPFDDSGPGARPQKGWDVEVKATERCAFDCFLV